MSTLILPDSYADRLAPRQRRHSLAVPIGDHVTIGGDAPVVVQSMCTTPTQDIAATVAQCISLAEVGCEMVRITAPGVKDAACLKDIRREFSAAGFAHVPLVADIHFMPAAAHEAIEHVEKVRVNPGNYADKKKFAVLDYTDAEYQSELERLHERFSPLAKRAKELGRALRIGVNHGSLSDRIMNRYGDTPEGMVEAALEFLAIAEDVDFHHMIVSMKSSNPKVMVQAYRMLVAALDKRGTPYPLHLGVTEAGDGEDGRVKGAAGIGALLDDGLGDTIRVSLTEAPEAEVPVAQRLRELFPDQSSEAFPDLSNAPAERLDPFHYQRRRAEIVRFDQATTLGGGQIPIVLVPQRLPISEQDGAQADGHMLDDLRWSDFGDTVLQRASGCAVQLGETITLLGIDAGDPVAGLRRDLAAAPEDRVLGIADPGSLGTTRAYRLLAAVDEALFEEAEQAETGSGVRHAIVIALPGEDNLLQASATAGGLLIDGIGDAIYLPSLEAPQRMAFTVLQAVKARTTRADYVACPSCGRTLFDLMEVTEHIKQATNHLNGVTIAIMGCIVNGPGEMADADFGYVGAGPGKITLYRGKEAVRRNIPSAEARDQLIELIKEHGMWQDPPES